MTSDFLRLREWSPAAQVGHLASCGAENDTDGVELWRVRKGDRELRCRVHYLPTGIDVRLFEGEAFRRTQLVRDASETEALSHRWKAALVERGWADSSGEGAA